MGINTGCQKSLAIQMPKLRKRAIHILSLFKKRGFIPGGAEKGGVFGRTSVLCQT